MINYIIQVVLFQVLFVAVYDFFLSKETFFTKNRWYLLGTAVLSFVLPLFKIPTVQKAVPQEYYILLPEVVLSPQKVIEKAAWYQTITYLDVLFWSGCILFLIVFLVKLERIIRLVLRHGTTRKDNYKLILLPNETKAFSFFNYIFLGNDIPSQKREKIIQHELVHSEEKHTIDLLFFEFLKIVMWFNPIVYVYQNRISLVHEYISDAVASKSDKKENYINHLLADIFQVEHISFINQFYKHSLIKKRIIMMTKTQSKKVKQLKYMLLIPLLGSMVLYTACSNETSNVEQQKENSVMYLDEAGINKQIFESKQSYMDTYMGAEEPKTNKVELKDLTSLELSEYKEVINRFKRRGQDVNFKIYEGFENKDRKILFIDMSASLQKVKSNKENKIEGEEVPFSMMDKAPTFPGCAEGDKACFNRSLQRFLVDKFDDSLAKTLGLPSGRKRIYIQFKIDKKGNVTDIKVRAPHPTLKQHAEELAQELPKMQPGEKDGKIVETGFVLPITFNVE
ncbi:BlaR1 peptidase M56 [Tenacibaculum sediminilitoris]|uniref:M56 family metallopeptidase n=1 Tax=Tenacibaculum sediminilitoris TaxID=1820334 RepID=UPI003896431B